MNQTRIEMKRNLLFVPLFIMSFLYACNNENARESQIKHRELLRLYEDSSPLKVKAVRFLIENMDAHYSISGDAVHNFHQYMDSIFTLPIEKDSYYRAAYDTAYMRYGKNMMKEIIEINDTVLVTSEILKRHVDAAFCMWNQKWSGSYDFDHFCNYVLPYRIDDEPLCDWRTKYIEEGMPKVAHLSDSQENAFYVYGTYAAINTNIPEGLYYMDYYTPTYPLDKLDKLRMGICRDYVNLNIARLRALGVPAAKDFAPQWGNRSLQHEWAVILPNKDTFFPFGQNDPLGEHFFNRGEYTTPKVFRKMYAKQTQMKALCEAEEPIPDLFRSPTLMDVTDKYTPTCNVVVNLFRVKEVLQRKWIYLATFDNSEWRVVAWGRRKGTKAFFEKMGKSIVYLPVYCTEGQQLLPAGHPFLVTEDGEVKPLVADTAHRQTVRLTRKYRFTYWLKELCRRTEGGRFQVANNEDFSDSVTIATIGSVRESRFHSLPTTCDTTYRYFRYLSPKGSYGNMAEVEMYDSLGNRPTIKRMFGMRYAVGTSRLEKLFDGDVLTCYNRQFPDDGWAAVEFEEPQHISEVRFLPRNDDNFIREGEQYELYYWDGRRFASIARMEGNREGVLYVDNVPTNALLLLRNHTKGKEERIFTYENGEQVWW